MWSLIETKALAVIETTRMVGTDKQGVSSELVMNKKKQCDLENEENIQFDYSFVMRCEFL